MRMLDREVMGEYMQRNSGWRYAMAPVQEMDNGTGIVFDDCIEKTFAWSGGAPIPTVMREQPWVGMLHSPLRAIEPFIKRGFVEYANYSREGAEALENLAGICTMSPLLAENVQQVCDVPVNVILYPTNTDVKQFDMDEYLKHPQLIHSGWCLKNLWLLWHIPPHKNIPHKIYIRPGMIGGYEKNVKKYLREHTYPHRAMYDDVQSIEPLDNEAYDDMLSRSVVALELVDCAGVTAIVEAIARCTPVLIKRHQAVVDYIGEDYPLFFADISECGRLMHPYYVLQAHNYLKRLDKSFLDRDNFMQEFRAWISQHE